MRIFIDLNKRLASGLSLVTAMLLAVTSLAADELLMKDGSRLIGKIGNQTDGTLEFETTYAGTIKVKFDQISELHADEPVKLMFKNDELQEATSITRTESAILVTTETGDTPESLDRDSIAYINPESWRYGEGHKFTGRLNLALKFQRGNTVSDEIDFDTQLGWRWKSDRILVFGQLEKDSSFGDTTAENWLATAKYDHFQTEKFYYGVNTGFEHDKFADLDLRSRIGPHIGYQFFEKKKMNLSTDIGLTYVDENFITVEDDTYMAVSWLIDFDWFIIDDHLQFYHRHNGLLSVADAGDLVINSWTGFRLPLIFGIVASLEGEINYDGGVPVTKDKTDTTYRVKLGYQW